MNLFQDMRVPAPSGRHPYPRPENAALLEDSGDGGLDVVGNALDRSGFDRDTMDALRAVRNLWKDKLEREDVSALLGIPYFLLMFLPIPFVSFAYLYGIAGRPALFCRACSISSGPHSFCSTGNSPGNPSESRLASSRSSLSRAQLKSWCWRENQSSARDYWLS